jgi:hypothetical protein
MLWPCFREVMGSSLGRDTAYPDKFNFSVRLQCREGTFIKSFYLPFIFIIHQLTDGVRYSY